MRRVNHNTSALTSALKSDLPTLRKEARRLVLRALETEGTQQKAAAALGTYDRSLRIMLKLIEEMDAKRSKKRR
jgi:hypothetical protein